MRRLALLGALAFLAVGCGGGGGGSASGNDIARAATKTAKAGSLEADFTITGQGLKGTGTGVFNTGKERTGQLSMKVTTSGREIPVDTIVTGDVFYMRSPVFSRATQGKEWIKLDLGALSKQRGLDLSSLLNASPTPTNALAYLEGAGGDVQKVGTESVGGVKTTHYTVNADLERAADKATGSTKQALRRVISQSKLKKLPLDVWIDGNGYIRKVSYAEHAGRQQAAKVTIELHDFSTPVSIKPPPSGSVVDLMKTLNPGS
jgi:hypothetical protein